MSASPAGENPLLELMRIGQSVWIDYLSRDLLQSGKLKQLIEDDGILGVTSNPTIFQKAIHGSELYDDSLRRMVAAGEKDPKELFLGLEFEDVGAAADLLLPSHRQSGGGDGFVSIEVSPDLAGDTEATVKEVKRLARTLNRANVLVKVPATDAGVPAIERLTGEGINVNVTLLFSVPRYRQVAEAYLRGLEQRLERGESLSGAVSVASFFVSRVDTLVDRRLDAAMDAAGDGEERRRLEELKGRAAVANARLAYQAYRDICAGGRWRRLQEAGARRQRLLWASSSTKNPAYSDIKYVEELIAPETINTMTEATIEAFRDHGSPRVSIEDDMDRVRALWEQLAAAGIEEEQVGGQLEDEGVAAFSDSFFTLLDEIRDRRDRILGEAA